MCASRAARLRFPAVRWLTVAAIAGVTLTVAACGSTASPAAPSVSSGPAGSPATSVAPSNGASPAASAMVSPSPDLHGAPELEALLPDTIGTTTLSKFSLAGADFFSTGDAKNQAQLTSLLGELGASPDDLRVAEAHDPQGALVFEEGIFQVKGADGAKLLTLWIAQQQAAMNQTLKVSNTTVGGRAMTLLLDPARSVGGSTYAIAIGDSIYLVSADDRALVTEAVGEIPSGG